VEFSLQGSDLRELERLTTQAMDQLRTIPGLVDLDSSVKPNKPTVEVNVQREAANDLGLSLGSVGNQLRILVAGQTVTSWRAADDQTYDVNVRLAPNARDAVQDLERLPFTLGTNADGSPRVARLTQVANIQEGTGPNQINRRDLMREVAINANVYSRSTGEVSADIRKVMDSIQMPPGYRYQFGGSTKSMQESFDYAISALLLASVFIYMILASQFKSFLQPMALMTALPLTLIGVVLALLLFGFSLSMFSVIGVIMLMRLVTKNAILLVDFAIRAREPQEQADGSFKPGLSRHDALLLAAEVRLRPILMTTLAMIGGVITSSLLTLVVVPVVYCYLDDLADWLKHTWSSGSDSPAR